MFYTISSIQFRCYWGYCFESLATEDPGRGDGELIHHVDANIEYCSVIKTKLGAHRILMGAEMDCCDSTDDGRRFYVELKTSREVGTLCFFSILYHAVFYSIRFLTSLPLIFFLYQFRSWSIIPRKDSRERSSSSFGYS